MTTHIITVLDDGRFELVEVTRVDRGSTRESTHRDVAHTTSPEAALAAARLLGWDSRLIFYPLHEPRPIRVTTTIGPASP